MQQFKTTIINLKSAVAYCPTIVDTLQPTQREGVVGFRAQEQRRVVQRAFKGSAPPRGSARIRSRCLLLTCAPALWLCWGPAPVDGTVYRGTRVRCWGPGNRVKFDTADCTYYVDGAAKCVWEDAVYYVRSTGKRNRIVATKATTCKGRQGCYTFGCYDAPELGWDSKERQVQTDNHLNEPVACLPPEVVARRPKWFQGLLHWAVRHRSSRCR